MGSLPANIPLARASHMTKGRLKGDRKVDNSFLGQSYMTEGQVHGGVKHVAHNAI